MFWEVGQGFGMESYTTHIPFQLPRLPAQLLHTAHAQGTHTEIWEVACKRESSVLPILCFWSHRLPQRNPSDLSQPLNTRNQRRSSPFLSCQLLCTTHLCTDRPSHYAKALKKKQAAFELRPHAKIVVLAVFPGIGIFIRVISVLSQGSFHSNFGFVFIIDLNLAEIETSLILSVCFGQLSINLERQVGRLHYQLKLKLKCYLFKAQPSDTAFLITFSF